jgi:hypothetical protein
MKKESQTVNVLPGASSLGYGFNIATAASPTSFQSQIIDLNEKEGTTINKFGIDYLLPSNVSEIDRNIISILYNSFTSESQYCDYMSAQVSGSGSGWGFSAEFAASYSNLSQGDNTNFYGLIEANSILWDTQLKSITGNSLNTDFVKALDNLPITFGINNQLLYFAFFDVWGTHVVNQSRVGGSLNYLVTSENSSSLTQTAAAASMQCEYSSMLIDASASAEAEWNNMASSWISSRKAELKAVGGEPSIMNAVVIPTSPTWNPDNSSSNLVSQWTDTLPENPGVITVSLSPISHVISGLGKTPKDVARYQNVSNQLAIALAIYLNAPITVSNTSSFTVDKTGWMPYLSGTSTTIAIDENIIAPPNPPRITDLSMYWIVMADENGKVKFNQNFNTEDPDDFDKLINAAKSASNNNRWWVCISIVNQTEAPVSVTAINWLKMIGIDTSKLQPEGFYPGMCGVASMIGKTNCSYQQGQMNKYQPFQTYWGYGGQTQDINISVAKPAFVAVNG